MQLGRAALAKVGEGRVMLGRVHSTTVGTSTNHPTSPSTDFWICLDPEVGIDPGIIEFDPSILDRFEIDSIQIMGLERQIDLTLKWSELGKERAGR